jgi:hypothetical protein
MAVLLLVAAHAAIVVRDSVAVDRIQPRFSVAC